MEKGIAALLGELKAGLLELYGAQLKGLYLYGSYARDEADEESDVDVLIVLDQIDRYGGEIDRTSFLASELSLKYGVTVSCVFTTEEKWRREQTMFFINVREEAIAA